MDPGDARNAFVDPLTRFTCILSAIIHDVGHYGVSNSELVKGNETLAALYDGRSVAEQLAIMVAWTLLMRPEYANLRAAIYHTEEEMYRFRYLLVHAVMATDIADEELRQTRERQWQVAFSDPPPSAESSPQSLGVQRSVLAIQTLIQASDLAHMMQHWDVYRKWNERYFEECTSAFLQGRAESDPSINWYAGELGFFDNCVIPLAKRLKDCGVFGVSCEEYLTYALKNREEWASRGVEVTRDMIAKHVTNKIAL
jgi:3'5'-cyclic nucleotide phosphodiesterase